MFEFDPSIDGPTPEHVRWTLVHNCPLRAGTDVSDPDQTERLLRALPHLSLARVSDTAVGSLVLRERVNGQFVAFDANQASVPFGGEEQIDRCCRDCPANVKGTKTMWSQCFGTVALPVDPVRRARLLNYFDNPPENERTERLARRVVENRWHKMWSSFQEGSSPVASDELLTIASDIWFHEEIVSASEKSTWMLFFLALFQTTNQPNLRMAISLHPAGVTYERTWQVDPHCIRCKATWRNERRQSCEMCGHQGGRQPSRTRKRIGTRPFRPIEDFVPADQVPAIIQEWSARWDKVNAAPNGESLLSRFLSTFSSWLRRRGGN